MRTTKLLGNQVAIVTGGAPLASYVTGAVIEVTGGRGI